MKCIGPFGTGNRNERGERLLDFAEENNLVVTNSFFLKATNSKSRKNPPHIQKVNETKEK